jgi:hypothetical protein
MTAKFIFTAGTDGLVPADLARWVLANGEPAVLDARYAPWSQRPEWSMPALLASMPGYLWLGRCLGNRRYNEPGAEIELADPERGVRIASRLLERRSILLLCRCASHWGGCHRAEAAELIATATGATIQPLTADEVRGFDQLDLLISNHRVTS